MKTAKLLAVLLVTLASLPLVAQQVGASTGQSGSASASGANINDSANANANGNFRHGQVQTNGAANSMVTTNGLPNANAASSGVTAAREHGTAYGAANGSTASYARMWPVRGRLLRTLDAKSARMGEPVVLKTTEKIRTANGMVIPKGSRLLGHVTEVQAHNKEHQNSLMGIEFDRAELKNGQSFAIHSMIESVSQPASLLAEQTMQGEDAFGGGMMGPGAMGPGAMGPGMGGGMMGRGMVGGSRMGGGLLGGAANTVGSAAGQIGPGMGANAGGALGSAANIDGNTTGTLSAASHAAGSAAGALHGAAYGTTDATDSLAARATGIPGVMLDGNTSGSASGVLSAAKKNIHLDSGTQMVVGVVASGK